MNNGGADEECRDTAVVRGISSMPRLGLAVSFLNGRCAKMGMRYRRRVSPAHFLPGDIGWKADATWHALSSAWLGRLVPGNLLCFL